MQVKIFTIPLIGNEEIISEMNTFLQVQKVLTLDKQLVIVGEQAYWSFCITYLTQTLAGNRFVGKQNKVDYKEILEPEDFTVFSVLRTIRKSLSERDAVPAYAIFTDSELAEIAKLKTLDPKNMEKIQGIGQKKVEKYGMALCEMYKEQMELDLK